MPNKKLTNSNTVKKQAKKPVKSTVNHRKIILSGMAVLALLFAFLPWQYAFAASPTILVDPYDNIPKEYTSFVTVNGAELIPNSVIYVEQHSSSSLPVAEGGGTEYARVATLRTFSDGRLYGSFPVAYDIVVPGEYANLKSCDTIPAEGKDCSLIFTYGGTGIEAGTTILVQKLYFGMKAPIVTPPPAATPVTKEDCKADRWKNFAALGIKNQGDCVSYVASKQ